MPPTASASVASSIAPVPLSQQDAQLIQRVDEALKLPIPRMAREIALATAESRQTYFRNILLGRMEARHPEDVMEARRVFEKLVYVLTTVHTWPALVQINAVRADTPLDITGELSDPQWSKANVYPFMHRCNWPQTVQNVPGSARVMWDARYLYLGYDMVKWSFHAPTFPHNGPAYEHDCAEFFIRPDLETQRYYEINASPSGSIYDAALDKNPDRWYGQCNPGYDVKGLLLAWKVWNDTPRADGMSRYTLEMGIPWSQILPAHLTARAGLKMAALLACSVEFDINRDFTHAYYCHSPIVGHFHNPDGFAPLTLT